MDISPYFSQSTHAPQFDDFGILSQPESLIVDKWLERAEDSDLFPPPLTRGQLVVTTMDRQLQGSDNGGANNTQAFSNQIERLQTFGNAESVFQPFTDKAPLRPIDSDATLSPFPEHLATPTPMPRFKPPWLTSINSDVQLSPSASPPLATRDLVTHISNPQNSKDHLPSKASRTSNIDLVPTSILPDRLRPLFPFQYFNAMQSQSLPALYSSDHNIVLSAPTGSGKTTCFELAIARLMKSMDFSVGNFKVRVLQSLFR